MNEQIANRQLTRDVRVGESETGQVANHWRVPFQLPFLDEQCQRRSGEYLRVGRNAEQRAPINRRRFAQRPNTVALRESNLPSLTIASATPGT